MAYDGMWCLLPTTMDSMNLTSEGDLPAPTFDLESWANNYEGGRLPLSPTTALTHFSQAPSSRSASPTSPPTARPSPARA